MSIKNIANNVCVFVSNLHETLKHTSSKILLGTKSSFYFLLSLPSKIIDFGKSIFFRKCETGKNLEHLVLAKKNESIDESEYESESIYDDESESEYQSEYESESEYESIDEIKVIDKRKNKVIFQNQLLLNIDSVLENSVNQRIENKEIIKCLEFVKSSEDQATLKLPDGCAIIVYHGENDIFELRRMIGHYNQKYKETIIIKGSDYSFYKMESDEIFDEKEYSNYIENAKETGEITEISNE